MRQPCEAGECAAGASAGLTSGQVATLDVLVKEMLGRSDRPFSIGDIMQRCSEKKLALSEAAVSQARPIPSPALHYRELLTLSTCCVIQCQTCRLGTHKASRQRSAAQQRGLG